MKSFGPYGPSLSSDAKDVAPDASPTPALPMGSPEPAFASPVVVNVLLPCDTPADTRDDQMPPPHSEGIRGSTPNLDLSGAAALNGINLVRHIHRDNAGEFVSNDFYEFLDNNRIASTTNPPYTSVVNGIAERAIGSVFKLVRAYINAAGAPIRFWPYAALMAADVLNKTFGPPNEPSCSLNTSPATSYTMLTGKPTKILDIMPFGCHCIITMPPVGPKRAISARGWAGINLGKSATVLGAYHAYVPEDRKVVTSCNVVFDENVFPWRGSVEPIRVAHADVHPTTPNPSTASQPAAMPDNTANGQFSQKTMDDTTTKASCRPILLHLFSGPYHRKDGLAYYMNLHHWSTLQVDAHTEAGGG